ncbi:hypothetical protein [Paraburkholderia caribensis]|uniref:hypothetical protein n=1 Tax=Paraburkholderia caribensis TaxID=75105 RepID=UPI001CB11916|nr:hypothetical protein [Paraburkholderia caribensis]CAG9243765.1 conserved hypothetical protein [Paraburkholderia caribensis]
MANVTGVVLKASTILVLVSLCGALVGCEAPLIGTEPGLAGTQRDDLQRSASRPTIERDTSYETVVVERDFAIPLDQFSDWFAMTGAPRVASFLTGTTTVPGVIRSEPLIGAWTKVGDRRRIVFSDGNSALEEIVTNQLPKRFQYEMWNLTSRRGRYIRYAISEFSLSGNDGGTHVRWTYSFRPNAWPDGWFMSRYVHVDIRQFMELALTTMGKGSLPG